jgi:hypothetical protein
MGGWAGSAGTLDRPICYSTSAQDANKLLDRQSVLACDRLHPIIVAPIVADISVPHFSATV